MAFNLAPDVTALIASEGESITLKRVATSSYDPNTGSNTTTTATASFKGLILKYRDSLIDGSMIQRGDRRMVLDAAGATNKPQKGDQLTIGSQNYNVIEMDAVREAGVDLIYSCQVRPS